jgi:predicted PurR-regulated permease PerM
MSEQKLEGYFFTTILIAVLFLVGYIFYPFVGALALALVLAILAMPLYDRLDKHLHRPNLSALLVVVFVTLVILLPAAGLTGLLFEEMSRVPGYARGLDYERIPTFFDDINTRIQVLFPTIESAIDLSVLFQNVGSMAGGFAKGMFTAALDLFVKTILVLIALFFFLRDGHQFVRNIIKLSPLSDDEDRKIIKRLRMVTRSLIRGTMVIAVIKGVLVGIGFVIFGLAGPVLWGSVAAVSSLIPAIGTGLVMIPAFFYLVFTGSYFAAFGFMVWGILIVGFIDDILAPRLIGNGARIHPLFILLSVLGGLATFGIAGFLLGPLIFALLVALSEIYRLKVRQIHLSSSTNELQ